MITRNDRPAPVAVVRAALWMAGAIASFLGMAAAARGLATRMSVFEILAFRSLIGAAIMLPLALRGGELRLGSRRPALQIGRNVVHFAGQYGWVLAVAALPLAEAFTLEFTQPLWTVLLGGLFLGESLTGRRLGTVVLGFAGVLVVLRPGTEAIQPAALVMLGAALCYSSAMVALKALTRADSAFTIVLWMTIVQLPLGLVPALLDWVAPGWSDVPWLVLIGVTGLTAHYCLARALALADAMVVVPLEYVRLPAAAALGAIAYGEGLDLSVLLGAAIIFGANYANVAYEARRRSP